MAQVIAVTEIHRTVEPGKKANLLTGEPAVAPKQKIIKPGTVFVADGKELDQFIKAKAVRFPEPPKQTETARAQLRQVGEGVETEEDIDPENVDPDGPVRATSTTNRNRAKATPGSKNLV